MAVNTFASTGQRTAAVAAPSRTPPVSMPAKTRPARPKRYGIIGRSKLGIIKSAVG